jgi:hypothetical protein
VAALNRGQRATPSGPASGRVLRPRAARPDAFHTISVIQEVGYGLMSVEAVVTHNTTMEIIKDARERLTISIPDGLLPVNLIVDPPRAARLVQLLANYAEKAKCEPTVVHRENPASWVSCTASA